MLHENEKKSSCSFIKNIFEKILCSYGNIGIVIITAIWFVFSNCYSYYNTNFDMNSTLLGYILVLSVVAIIIGIFHKNSGDLVRVGVITIVI